MRLVVVASALATFLMLAFSPIGWAKTGASPARLPVSTIARPAPEWPNQPLPIRVSVVEDRLDDQGRWRQTVSLTILSGGTLAEASLVAYGDLDHVDEIFQAARRNNPSLPSPARVPAGQVIELTMDPAVSYVQREVQKTDDVLRRSFTNGVEEVRYLRPTSSIVRFVQFPSRAGVNEFTYPDAGGPVNVVPGGRIVEFRYIPGEAYEDLVQKAIGFASFDAASDFTKQTSWDPTRWPPPPGEARRAVFRPTDSYAPRPQESIGPTNPDPAAQDRLRDLIAAREKAGIWAIRRESTGLVYRVAIGDPTVTARQVARLLYGAEDGYFQLAQRAGFPVSSGDPTADQFDPKLFGRAFEVLVEYTRENFVLDEADDAEHGRRIIRLLNGTRIERYENARRGRGGLQEIIVYPNGYTKLVYRPNELIGTLADALALLQVGGPGEPEMIEQARQSYAADIIWRLAPDLPRDTPGALERLELRPAYGGRVVEAILAPVPQRSVDRLVTRATATNPCLSAVVMVVLGSLVVVVVGIAAARRQAAR
ncbi:MAG: hypothetical protein HYY04_08330 [Chloroflexi bacterium]|nr:hypothetical protein [Chloroflexota bacterium]